MPERRTGTDGGGWRRARGARALLPLCFALLLPGAGAALPPDQISLDLEARLAALADAAALPGEGAAALIAAADLPGHAAAAAADPAYGPVLGPVLAPDLPPAAAPLLAVPAAFVAAAPAADRLNLRLAFTMLSQSHGDEENGTVLAAQADPGRNALVLQSGEADLAALARLLADTGLAGHAEGAALVLETPLVIWPGATLRLRAGDELRLSRSHGAFILNFGTLAADGAAIGIAGEQNVAVPRFRPFITTADSGELILRNAAVSGLGFGETVKFSGVSVLRSLLRGAERPLVIENTRFTDVQSLTVQGDAGTRITGNLFRDMRGPALVISRVARAEVAGNLFSGAMPTNAIRLEGGSADGTIAANVILGGERAGIVVRNDSPGATVTGNVVWHRAGGGIAVQNSACASVTGNLVIANDQKGIELRNAPGGTVAANSVLSNQSIAIWISNQPPGAETRIAGNVIAFNAAGLAAGQGGTLLLQGNDLTRQYLQFVTGDLTPMSNSLAGDIRGAAEIVLRTGTVGTAAAAPDCGAP